MKGKERKYSVLVCLTHFQILSVMPWHTQQSHRNEKTWQHKIRQRKLRFSDNSKPQTKCLTSSLLLFNLAYFWTHLLVNKHRSFKLPKHEIMFMLYCHFSNNLQHIRTYFYFCCRCWYRRACSTVKEEERDVSLFEHFWVWCKVCINIGHAVIGLHGQNVPGGQPYPLLFVSPSLSNSNFRPLCRIHH